LTSSLGLRDGLRHLGTGLIVYGAVGLIVAAIGFGTVIWVDERVGAIRKEVDATLTKEAAVIELAAQALHDAATTAQSFTVTVDQSSLAVASAAGTITELRSDLVALEDQLRSVNILGATPLATSADAVGRIVASITGLDTRLSLTADGLVGNRMALAENATSLEQLADTTEDLAAQRRSDARGETLGEIQGVASMTLMVLTLWSAVPAVGALILGIWLRRRLRASGSA
jgi:hypothetical protein